MNPVNNPPAVATLLTAFLVSLLDWAWTLWPESTPDEVLTTGHVLAAAGLALLVGWVAQRFTVPKSYIEGYPPEPQ